MKRAAGKKTWIKIYPIQCLQGSIRWQLDAAERGVWYDLLNLAAIMPTPGAISDSDMRPVPHAFIAHQLNIDVDLLKTTLDKCIKEGRITENNNGLHITNWEMYQSEYQRQDASCQRGKEAKEASSSAVAQKEKAPALSTEEIKLFTILEELKTFPRDRPVLKLRGLQADYPRIDYKLEFKKFVEYWSTERRKLKKPWLALRNWLEKAQKKVAKGRRPGEPSSEEEITKSIKEAGI